MLKLKTQSEFIQVYNKGKKNFGYYQLIYFRKNNLKENRLGVVASKKTGNAVCRSKLKRLFREEFRTINKEIKQGYDIIFIAKRTAGENYKKLGLNDLLKDCRKILKRSEVLL